jgi:hypothetical protein
VLAAPIQDAAAISIAVNRLCCILTFPLYLHYDPKSLTL